MYGEKNQLRGKGGLSMKGHGGTFWVLEMSYI